MPTPAAISDALKEAKLAVRNAQEVRSYHRRRTERGDKQRDADLALAVERVRAAMKPLRSAIGKIPHERPTAANLARHERVREASKALQRERRKLWKMQSPTERNT